MLAMACYVTHANIVFLFVLLMSRCFGDGIGVVLETP
jgi:hypothetical protein